MTPRDGRRQATLGGRIHLDGCGVHTGARSRITLHPADADSGLVFLRTDLPDARQRFIPAHADHVVSSELATRLGSKDALGDGIGTVEHVLAALAACGIDNALIEVDGPEVPILDGSAAPFVTAIDEVGLSLQRAGRAIIEIVAPVRVRIGTSVAELRPAADGLKLDVAIDYVSPVVGRQRHAVALDAVVFRRDIAPARTFGFVADVEALWRAGFARGASFENTIVVDDARVLNAGGLRSPNEFARHKMMDAIGDLALAGAPIQGAFRSFRGGHALNHALVAALLADRSAWRWAQALRSPAAGAGRAMTAGA